MSLGKRQGLRLICGALFLGMLAGCVAVKPGRLLPPEALGLTCTSDDICVDDVSRQSEAERLTQDALAFVENRFGPIKDPPRIYFCSTNACFAQFGDPRVSGLYFWATQDIAINDKGWRSHIVRHELIHHWQNETYGMVQAGNGLPRWYIEGMAYVFSEDPRPVIPNEKAQGQRARFKQWIDAGNDWRVVPVNEA